MKKIIGILFLFITMLLLTACGGSGNHEKTAAQAANEALYKLAYRNGCNGCHRVKATVVGPSWEAISQRFKDVPLKEARALLIERVTKGSRGQWVTFKGGNGMPPMENRVSAEHIVQLVDYILSLSRKP